MHEEYKGPERRRGLSEADIEHIAELAAEKALDRVYAKVGKSVLNRAAFIVGAAVIALLMWLGKNGVSIK